MNDELYQHLVNNAGCFRPVVDADGHDDCVLIEGRLNPLQRSIGPEWELVEVNAHEHVYSRVEPAIWDYKGTPVDGGVEHIIVSYDEVCGLDGPMTDDTVIRYSETQPTSYRWFEANR